MWTPFIDFFHGIIIHKHISTSQNKKGKKKENNFFICYYFIRPLVEYLAAFIRRRACIWRVCFITWLSCLRALLAYMPTRLTWLRDYVLNLDTCLRALRAYVFLNFICLSALNDFEPTCTRPSVFLRAYIPSVPSVPSLCLRTYVS